MTVEPIKVLPAPTTAEAPRLTNEAPRLLTQTTTTTTSTPTQGNKTVFNKTEDLVAFGKENLDAFAAAGKIWAVGVQDLTKLYAATAKDSLEESIATFKALTSVKSVKEAIEVQSNFSKSMVAKAVAESNKMTEASLKLTEQAMAPITARVAAAMGTMSQAA